MRKKWSISWGVLSGIATEEELREHADLLLPDLNSLQILDCSWEIWKQTLKETVDKQKIPGILIMEAVPNIRRPYYGEASECSLNRLWKKLPLFMQKHYPHYLRPN